MAITLPALFQSADTASNSKQSLYLNLVRFEYACLFISAIFALNIKLERWYYLVYFVVFGSSLISLLYRSLKRPEQDWYQARAMAESVKTLSWRYSMRAEPFDDARQADARADFNRLLGQLLASNKSLGHAFTASSARQITDEMSAMREANIEDRRSRYLSDRIHNQRTWYELKAKSNRKWSRIWLIAGCATYVLGLSFILGRVLDPTSIGWPTDPLVVLASAIIGWTQIKKFNELASAYTLTAHEIGLTEEKIREAANNGEFSAAVNEAELAFSREHTQWVARQTN